MSTTREDNAADWVEQIGKPAFESIAEMVAALEADRDRLEELRDERKDLLDAIDAEEDSRKRKDAAIKALADWDDENGEELAELVAAVTLDGDEVSEEDARQRIEEDPLSLRIFGERTDGEWTADRFELLLGTGGPAVRIMGELEDGEPTRAWLEVQDWFKPWTQYLDADQETLLTYCRCFYFGE